MTRGLGNSFVTQAGIATQGLGNSFVTQAGDRDARGGRQFCDADGRVVTQGVGNNFATQAERLWGWETVL